MTGLGRGDLYRATSSRAVRWAARWWPEEGGARALAVGSEDGGRTWRDRAVEGAIAGFVA